MSRALKKVGTALGAVALVAGTIATGGTLGIVAAGIAATAGTISTAAGILATVASIGSQALAKNSNGKPPNAQGSVTSLIVDPNAPAPYVMGEMFFAGARRHIEGYGGTVDGVENPYLLDIVVYGHGGPYESITPWVMSDQLGPIPAWYTGYIGTDTQLGAKPEASALSAPHGSPSNWGASHKLSGQPAIAWGFKFDKTGKKFASGLPATGALIEGAKVYDPRQDDTFPGGSGPCRLGNESTYVYNRRPALHAAMYAYGRYQNGKRVLGIGLPADGIDWAVVAAWANTCDLNGWTIGGVVFEPGSRWDNLKEICAAGGAEPIPGAILSFKYPAAAVALDTITIEDSTDEADSVVAMQSYRDRVNTVLPKYRSPDHNWEMTQAEAISVPAYVSEDGEERPVEWPFNLVTDKDQAAQLAAYKLVDARELVIELTCKPRLRGYRPGDCLAVDRPDLGFTGDAIVLRRELDPATMKVRLTLLSETAGKHAFALGETGTAPPTPALGQTAQVRDETAAGAAAQVKVDVVRVKAFSADASGTVTSTLPSYIVPVVTLDGNDVRTSDAVSYAISTSGVTASVENTLGDPNKGTITITAVDALEGWIDLTVTVGGVAQPAIRIATNKATGLPPGLGGSGSTVASDSSFPSLTTTSFVDLTDTMTVTLAGGQTLYGNAPLDYGVGGTTALSRSVTAKWQYSVAGAGVWNDMTTGAITGTPATGGYAYEPGHGDFNDSKSGLGAGDYDVKLVGKLSASGATVNLWGTAVIEART